MSKQLKEASSNYELALKRGERISELLEKLESLQAQNKKLVDSLKISLNSFEMIRNLFRKYPEAMEFLKGPMSIILSPQTELEELLKEVE